MRKRAKNYRDRLKQNKLRVRERRAQRRLLLEQAYLSENGIGGNSASGSYNTNDGATWNLQSSSSNIPLPLPFQAVGINDGNRCNQVCGIKVEQELVIKEEPWDEYVSSEEEQNRQGMYETPVYEETSAINLPVSQLTEEEDPLALEDGETGGEGGSLSEGEPYGVSPSDDDDKETDSIVIVNIESQLSVSPEPGEALDFLIDEDNNTTEEMETYALPSSSSGSYSPVNTGPSSAGCEKPKPVDRDAGTSSSTNKEHSNPTMNGNKKKSYQLRHHQNSTDVTAELTPSSSPTYICVLCDETFGSSSKLSEHYTDHSILRELQCQICQRIFPTFCKLRAHVNDYYIKKVKVPPVPELINEFQCPVCDIISITKYDMEYHGQTHELDDLLCKICVQCFPSFEALVSHAKEHQLDTYPCTVCDRSFKGRNTVINHVLEKHKDYLETCCEFCGDRFESPEDVDIHREQIHASDIKWVNKFQKSRIQKDALNEKKKSVTVQAHSNLRCCKKCGTRVRACWMQSHQASTACRLPSWSSCKKCGKKFRDQESFKAHKHVGFQCPFCPASQYHYAREKALLRHLAVSHLTPEGFVELNIPPDAERKHVCKKCNASYMTSKALKEHKIYHGIPAFQCPDCPQKLFTNYQLFQHKMKEHGKYTIGLTKGQRIVCDQCPSTFATRNGYIRHKKVTHCETPSPVQCHICGKSVTYKDGLRRHVRTVHAIHVNVINKE